MNINQIRAKIIILLLPVVIVGCATTLKLYEGPKLPQDKIAIIQLGPNVCAVTVDGVDTKYSEADLFLLPGNHTIEIFYISADYRSEDSQIISFKAEAGKQYYIESGFNFRSWEPYIREMEHYKQKTLLDYLYPYRPGRDYK
jgi:hypothetical protein